MNYNAVIFDLDGTLLHTLEDLLDNLEYAFASLGLKGGFTREEMESFLGSGKVAQMERALASRQYSLELLPKLNDALSIRYELNAENKTRPFPGIVALLEWLKLNNIPTLCLTNKPHNVAVKVVEKYFPGLVLATYGIRENEPVKPDPSLVEKVLKNHNLDAKHVLYVGDSDVDMMTAKNGHLASCFVTWGYVRKNNVYQYNPKYVVDHPKEIEAILKRK